MPATSTTQSVHTVDPDVYTVDPAEGHRMSGRTTSIYDRVANPSHVDELIPEADAFPEPDPTAGERND
jgi:hypothetical protein